MPDPPAAPDAAPVYKAPVLQDMPPISAEANMRLTKAVQDVAGTGGATMRTARADFEFVARSMESWTGPAPWELPPNTMSRAFFPGEDVNVKSRITAQSAGETVDELARRLDPDTFRVYDKLAADKKAARDQVESALALRNVDVEKELTPLRTKIADLEDKLEDANKRKTKIYSKDLQELRGQLAAREAELMGADTTTAQIYRQQVMRADETMRDMSPAVSRAYARAQGKWDLHEGQRSQIDAMMNKGETTLEAAGPPKPTVVDKAEMEYTRVPLHEKVPELVPGRTTPKPGENAADTVKRVHQEEAKLEETAADTLIARIPKALEEGGAKIDVDGVEQAINLDQRITVEGDDGLPRNVTIREMLQEVHEYDEVMKAVTTCSAGPISATV